MIVEASEHDALRSHDHGAGEPAAGRDPAEAIHVTGNTVIDALLLAARARSAHRRAISIPGRGWS